MRRRTMSCRFVRSSVVALLCGLAMFLMAGCGGAPKAEPQSVELVAKLDVQSAKLANERDGRCCYVMSVHTMRINENPLPVIPERVMVLTAYSSGEPSREAVQDMLNVPEWNWESSTEGRISCGVPEIDDVTWQVQRSYGAAPAASTDTKGLRFLQSIRPTENTTWDLKMNPVLIIPLEAFHNEGPPPAERRGVAAICLIGLTGAKKVVRLSEPVVVQLDPDRPYVSSETSIKPLSPERIRELQGLAEKLAGLFKTEGIASYEASFAQANDFKEITKVTEQFRQFQQGGDGPLNGKEAFEVVLNHPLVLTFTATPLPNSAPTGEAIVASLGEPERKVAGVFERQTNSQFGGTEREKIQVDWYHWAWGAVAIDKRSGVCCAMRINAAQRRIEKGKLD